MRVLALEHRLRGCENVTTLGVRPNFADYTAGEREMILQAAKIYYPSPFYADLFDTMGIPTFPGCHTYKYVQDKIKQSALFQLLGIPHPRTRVFYGRRQQANILQRFDFPFVAKVPRGSAMGRGVFLIENAEALDTYCTLSPGAAYIQEYVPVTRDIRAVVIGSRVVHAYWRIAPPMDFRTNVAQGGAISLEPVPAAARDLALTTARRCRWDDVGLDIACHDGHYYVLEANMKYGKAGFAMAGIDYYRLMERLIQDGEI